MKPSASFRFTRWGFILLLAGGATMPLSGMAATPAACDRGCLRGVMDQYFAAVFRHDPAAAPLAGTTRATENARLLPEGGGVWKTITSYGAVQRRYFDVPAGQGVYFGILNEGPNAVIVSVRLKVVDRRVTEAEWTVARKEYGGLFSIEGLNAYPPRPDTPIPAGDRSTRAQLVALANAYFDGLENKDGSAIPHVEGCERIENGFKVTHRPYAQPMPPTPGTTPPPQGASPRPAPQGMSGDCADNLDRVGAQILKADSRRFPVVDEEAGVVMGTTVFKRPAGSTLWRNLLTEFFEADKNRIAAIYAAMYYLEPDAPDSSGWEETDR